MQEKTEGTYFDGLSSKPFLVSTGFNDDYSAVIFYSDEVPKTEWLVDEIIPDVVGGRITLRHLHLKEHALIVNDSSFREKFFYHFHRKGNKGLYHKILNAGSVIHVSIALSVIVVVAAAYFYFIPWLSEKAVDLLPVSYDITLGEKVYENYLTTEDIDSAKTEAVRQFAKKINFDTNRKLNFTVIDSKEVNAFALPDGNIIIYTGILNKIKTYPQLVALMSHEAAHVTFRHSMRSLCRSVSGYLIISVVTTDVNGIMAVLADNANNLNNLSYSRSFESESDEKGFDILTQNKIDPKGMIELFEILMKSEHFQIPQFLSTHPLTEERINRAKKLIESRPYSIVENSELENDFRKIKNN